MKTETIIKKAKALEEELNKYYQETDNSEILDVDTTIIGSGGTIHYKFLKTKVVRTETFSDGSSFCDEYKLSNCWEDLDLLEQVKYDARRLRKSWRVWKSENPDIELEKDDEDQD